MFFAINYIFEFEFFFESEVTKIKSFEVKSFQTKVIKISKKNIPNLWTFFLHFLTNSFWRKRRLFLINRHSFKFIGVQVWPFQRTKVWECEDIKVKGLFKKKNLTLPDSNPILLLVCRLETRKRNWLYEKDFQFYPIRLIYQVSSNKLGKKRIHLVPLHFLPLFFPSWGKKPILRTLKLIESKLLAFKSVKSSL